VGSTYTFPDGTVETNIISSVTHTSSLISSQGCDSVIVTTLNPAAINDEITLTGNMLSATQSGASYQWIDCATNTEVQNATAQSFSPQVDGSYACIISFNSCSDTSSCMGVILAGISEVLSTDWLAYPNPATDIINIKGNGIIQSLTLFDLRGAKLQTRYNTATLSVEELPKGSYILEIFDGDKIHRLMIIKQ